MNIGCGAELAVAVGLYIGRVSTVGLLNETAADHLWVSTWRDKFPLEIRMAFKPWHTILNSLTPTLGKIGFVGTRFIVPLMTSSLSTVQAAFDNWWSKKKSDKAYMNVHERMNCARITYNKVIVFITWYTHRNAAQSLCLIAKFFDRDKETLSLFCFLIGSGRSSSRIYIIARDNSFIHCIALFFNSKGLFVNQLDCLL